MSAPLKSPLHVGALFAGALDDGGFMEYGFRGLQRAQADWRLTTTLIDHIPPQPQRLSEALRTLAQKGVALVIAHGGQNDGAAQSIAAEFPHTRFAVTQGSVRGPNLASYEIRQEQSAFLAGIAAARLTRTGIVGHISGIRVRPGLMGRAAYAAGVMAADPDVRLLTTFCGTQDDIAVAERIAHAQAANGADVIFTMLNAAMPGAMTACRARGIRLIGNVRDWVAIDPALFAASAMADVGLGVYEACRDLVNDTWQADHIRCIGVENRDAVRLQLAPDMPPAIVEAVGEWQSRLAAGSVRLTEQFDGAEFSA